MFFLNVRGLGSNNFFPGRARVLIFSVYAEEGGTPRFWENQWIPIKHKNLVQSQNWGSDFSPVFHYIRAYFNGPWKVRNPSWENRRQIFVSQQKLLNFSGMLDRWLSCIFYFFTKFRQPTGKKVIKGNRPKKAEFWTPTLSLNRNFLFDWKFLVFSEPRSPYLLCLHWKNQAHSSSRKKVIKA